MEKGPFIEMEMNISYPKRSKPLLFIEGREGQHEVAFRKEKTFLLMEENHTP
jgi:hypothetical protein